VLIYFASKKIIRVCLVNLPGSYRVLGGHWGRESGYGERHKSVEDGESEIAEHR